MNRTLKEATVKRYHYQTHEQLRNHLADFVTAYNFARCLKTLKGSHRTNTSAKYRQVSCSDLGSIRSIKWRGSNSSAKGEPDRPYEYNRAMYKRRNEIERLFRRLKGLRRIFFRFEKLDVMFVGFIDFELIVDGLRIV